MALEPPRVLQSWLFVGRPALLQGLSSFRVAFGFGTPKASFGKGLDLGVIFGAAPCEPSHDFTFPRQLVLIRPPTAQAAKPLRFGIEVSGT
jgi:hypothetical protein